jgi:hypothetical protein
MGGAKSNATSPRKSQVEISFPTYRATELTFFQLLNHFHGSPWHKAGGRKKLNSASTFQTCSGT